MVVLLQAANASGVDANSYQIIKTGDGTFDVLATLHLTLLDER